MSHLEDERINQPTAYRQNLAMAHKFTIGCAHISVIKEKASFVRGKGRIGNDGHNFEDFSEFDYLKKYPKRFFPPIMALELENSLEDQLKIRDYLMEMLKISS